MTVTEKYGDFSGQNIMSFEAATMYILFSEIYQKRIKKEVEKKKKKPFMCRERDNSPSKCCIWLSSGNCVIEQIQWIKHPQVHTRNLLSITL